MAKKSVFIMILFLLWAWILGSPVQAQPAPMLSTTNYRLKDLPILVRVPSYMYVISRERVSNEERLKSMGIDIAAVQGLFENSHIYLDIMPPDLSYEINITVVNERDSKAFSQYADTDLQVIGQAVMAVLREFNNDGIKGSFREIHKINNMAFLVIDTEKIQGETTLNSRHYYTIQNGMVITANWRSFYRAITPEQEAVLKNIVSNIVFVRS
jgi:hypothetical protein